MSPRPAPAAGPDRPRRAAPLRLVEGGRTRAPTPRPSRPDRVATRTALMAIVGSLCAVGLVMVLSASAYTSLQLYKSVWTIFERQLLWMGLGVISLLVALRVPIGFWRRVRVPLLVGTMVLLVAVLVPGIGEVSGGSSRWIGVGLLRIQPSELMKLALAVFAADLLTRRADKLERTGAVVLPLLLVLAVSGLLVLKQPDMGTAIVLVCITFGLLYAGDVPLRPVLWALAATTALGLVFALAPSYRRDRLLSFINPTAHQSNSGYQVFQSLVGLGNGHLFGLGLGAGQQKWGLLPNPHTDFIFSVIGEETGLVGTLLVISLFFALAWYGIRAAVRSPDRFSCLLAVACVTWISAQAVINIGAVIGVLPVTGIPLPFISFGGSSLVITMAAGGILMNIAGHEQVPGVGSVPARTGPAVHRRR